MNFSFDQALEMLERTPGSLRSLLSGLSESWTHQNEGESTWSPFDVLGHLIHGEKTDWLERTQIILGDGDKRFTPFDRDAHFASSQGKTLAQLLDEFESLRSKNLQALKALSIQETDLQKTGIHPAFGEVTLQELLATWVVHDLNHLAQITRTMAHQYADQVGPWVQYLRILNQKD